MMQYTYFPSTSAADEGSRRDFGGGDGMRTRSSFPFGGDAGAALPVRSRETGAARLVFAATRVFFRTFAIRPLCERRFPRLSRQKNLRTF
jgi:hypothetical protein